MFVDIFLLLIGMILNLVAGIFSALTFLIPTQVITAIQFFFDQMHVIDFLVPMSTLMSVLGYWISFLTFYYIVKIVMWLYHIIRHGGDVDLPKLGEHTGINENMQREFRKGKR